MRFTRLVTTIAVLPGFAVIPFAAPSGAAGQEATPTTTYGCEGTTAAFPMAGMEGMAMATPAAEGDHDIAGMSVEFDQMYIDMMIPHHASIIALAQASHDRLNDERLQTMADAIISAQQAEIEELRGYREQWYGSPESMPMDEGMMGMMAEMMPGMGDMPSMQMQMNPAAKSAAFCAGENPDLAFIELTIPHHDMAIVASEAALEQATHDEIRAIAERVIQDQQREIDELRAIRQELTGESTPEA